MSNEDIIHTYVDLTKAFSRWLNAQVDEQQWVKPSEVENALGSAITAETLRAKVRNGQFEYGYHYIDTSDGDTPRYAFKIAAVREYFDTEPAKR